MFVRNVEITDGRVGWVSEKTKVPWHTLSLILAPYPSTGLVGIKWTQVQFTYLLAAIFSE